PDVGAARYTFGGGVGRFARARGLAAGHLRSVRHVDSRGRIRTAADDARDAGDRDAIWAFRGGAPVGLAAELHLDLVRPGHVRPETAHRCVPATVRAPHFRPVVDIPLIRNRWPSRNTTNLGSSETTLIANIEP